MILNIQIIIIELVVEIFRILKIHLEMNDITVTVKNFDAQNNFEFNANTNLNNL